MFRYQTKIFLRHTDATKGLYFGALFDIAMEAFEQMLSSSGSSVKRLLEQEVHAFPVVHARGDYHAPLRVDDLLDLEVETEKKTSSMIVSTKFYRDKILVAETELVHVFIDVTKNQPLPIPDDLIIEV